MVTIKSTRAKKILENPRFLQAHVSSSMKRFPGKGINLWLELEWDQQNVKNLSFSGELEAYQVAILETMANILIGKTIATMDSLSVRECEAYLRDRNSEMALEGISDEMEGQLKKVFSWVRAWPRQENPKEYVFHSGKGPFRQLKLVDKILELKGFLNSPEILSLYHNMPRPELVDVDDLTVYIQVSYSSDRDKTAFENLHLLGVEIFKEENLNFIPDA